MSTHTMPTTQLNCRIDAELKERAEAMLAQLGLSAADYTRIAFQQLVNQQRVPFDLKVPNAETRAAIEEVRDGLPTYTNAKTMVNDILSDAD